MERKTLLINISSNRELSAVSDVTELLDLSDTMSVNQKIKESQIKLPLCRHKPVVI